MECPWPKQHDVQHMDRNSCCAPSPSQYRMEPFSQQDQYGSLDKSTEPHNLSGRDIPPPVSSYKSP
jgi:hypothetical protein